MKRIASSKIFEIKPVYLNKSVTNQEGQLVLFYDNPKGNGEVLALIKGRVYDTDITDLDLFFEGSKHNPVAVSKDLAVTMGEFEKGGMKCEL